MLWVGVDSILSWWKYVESCYENIIARLYILLVAYYIPSSINTNIFRSCIRAQLPAPTNKYPPENCNKNIQQSDLSLLGQSWWLMFLLQCPVQAWLTGRPPYPGHDNRQSRFVKTRTSLLTDWAPSRCDDFIPDGQCLSQLESPVCNCD